MLITGRQIFTVTILNEWLSVGDLWDSVGALFGWDTDQKMLSVTQQSLILLVLFVSYKILSMTKTCFSVKRLMYCHQFF